MHRKIRRKLLEEKEKKKCYKQIKYQTLLIEYFSFWNYVDNQQVPIDLDEIVEKEIKEDEEKEYKTETDDDAEYKTNKLKEDKEEKRIKKEN